MKSGLYLVRSLKITSQTNFRILFLDRMPWFSFFFHFYVHDFPSDIPVSFEVWVDLLLYICSIRLTARMYCHRLQNITTINNETKMNSPDTSIPIEKTNVQEDVTIMFEVFEYIFIYAQTVRLPMISILLFPLCSE